MGFLRNLFKILSIVILTASIQPCRAGSQSSTEWTILMCLQANNDLGNFAIRNLKEMAMVGSSDKLKLLIQIEQPNKKGLWRYRIEKKKIELEEHIPSDMSGNHVKDLVSAANWAFKKYPSKHTGLIAWNHGSGIVDPAYWGTGNKALHGTLHYKTNDGQACERGLFFNYSNWTYMRNDQQSKALKMIRNNVLNGRKLDFLGLDACLMGGIEVAYQFKDYANLFVASEDIELALGWPYEAFLKPVSSGGASPLDLVNNIVLHYGNFYKNKIPWYTLSAVDLKQIDLIKEGLNQVILNLKDCQKIFGKKLVRNVVLGARKSSLQFNTPCYVDLHSFLKELRLNLNINALKSPTFEPDTNDPFALLESGAIFCNEFVSLDRCKDDPEEAVEGLEAMDLESLTKSLERPEAKRLKESLDLTMQAIKQVVLANTSGKSALEAKGLSIYFPPYGIDASYPKTEFAKQSLWLMFLKEIL